MQQFTDSNLQWQAQLSKEEQQLRELLKVVIKELSHAPEGSLTITRKGTRTWYRHRIPGKPSRSLYINQKNKALIYRLAQKRYDRKLLRAIKLELRQVEQGKHLVFSDFGAIYDSFPDNWKPFIKPHVLPDDLYAEQWLKKHQAHASGEEFKSKAEHLHDRIYRDFDLPHVYEPKLYLEGFGWVKPDFVVLSRRTRQTFYHEHFGMMDNPEYCARALSKLDAYHRNGYYEGKNLLITMESSLHPMNPGEVEALFQNYLL